VVEVALSEGRAVIHELKVCRRPVEHHGDRWDCLASRRGQHQKALPVGRRSIEGTRVEQGEVRASVAQLSDQRNALARQLSASSATLETSQKQRAVEEAKARATLERFDDTPPQIGRMVLARFRGTGTRNILLLAHMDTVYDKGMGAKQPFRIDGDRAYGLGIADDKSGVAVILHTVTVLNALNIRNYRTMTVLITDVASGKVTVP
jgi:Peptidase family M20/M25/M40